MTFGTFMNKIGTGFANVGRGIGNAFKNGYQSGNLQAGLMIGGSALTTIGLTGAMLHDMKKSNSCSSIFGNCHGRQSNTCGNSLSAMYMMNNFGLGGNLYDNMDMFNMNPYQSLGMSQQNPYAQFNPYAQLNQYQMPYLNYQTPQASWHSMYMDSLVYKPNIVRQNPDADAVDSSTSTAKAEELDDTTGKMVDSDGNANKKAKAFEIMGEDAYTETEDADLRDAYKTAVSDLAKSYIANLDTDGDGYVSEDEFVEHELKQLPSSASEDQKETARLLAQQAYQRININGSTTGIDWKEMAANVVMMDGGASDTEKLDGKITAENFEKYNDSLVSDPNTFSTNITKLYKGLFGKGDE